ncbi:MAG: hypothetical protein VW397_04760 [Candidatus Margulisiibacteriota bacterium]
MKIILLLIIISNFGHSIDQSPQISDTKTVFSISFNPYDYSSGRDGYSRGIVFGSLFRNTFSFGYEMPHLLNDKPSHSLMIEFYYYEANDFGENRTISVIESAYPDKEFYDDQYRYLTTLNIIRRNYINLDHFLGPIRLYSGIGAGLMFLNANYTDNNVFCFLDGCRYVL